MRIRFRRPSKSVTFALLMAASLVLALLPSRWTSWSGGIVQPVGWLQHAASVGTRTLADSSDRLGRSRLPPQQVEQLLSENEALRRQVGHQSVAISGLEHHLEQVTGLRDQLRDRVSRIQIAAVIAYDASPLVESLLIRKGSRDGVAIDHWVAAGRSLRDDNPDDLGRKLVSRQWLIGQISEVQPYQSRVRLATDRRFGPIRVTLASELPDGSWQKAESECLLSGVGKGRMLIDRATEDHLAAGRSLVLVQPSGGLPTSLVIGRIISSRRILEAPLHFDFDVRPFGDARRLDHVYVIVP